MIRRCKNFAVDFVVEGEALRAVPKPSAT